MGNDGGSIPTRRELVKEAARNPTVGEVKASKHEQQEYHWSTDPVTQQPLRQPVVSDAYGKLYNKDTILEFLLEGAHSDDVKRETRGTVQSMKDIVEVIFQVKRDSEDKGYTTWVCPMTDEPLGPGSNAVYIAQCGHAFHGNTFRTLFAEQCKECTSCGKEFAPDDAIRINPTADQDFASMDKRLKRLAEERLTHSHKKVEKNKKRKRADDKTVKNKPSAADADKTSSINNASTASLTTKVLQAQDAAKKRRLDSANVKSLFANPEQNAHNGKNSDFMTRGFSVPTAAKH